MTFIFDVDGVLLDWTTGFFKWVRKMGYEPVGEHDTWSLSDNFPTLSQDEIHSLISDFNTSMNFSMLPEIAGANEALVNLRARFPHTKFVALTSAGNHPATVAYRALQITCFRVFDECDILPLQVSKEEELKRYPERSIVFEDSVKHIESALKVGHYAVCFDQPWNASFRSTHPRFSRLKGWRDVINHLDRSVALAA